MSSPSTEVVSINLNKPFAARVVEIKELIQKPAYVKVRELIRHQLSADDSKETAGVHSLHRQHNAIAISGGRGTGKTTFMLSLQKILEEDAENEGPGNWTTNIVWLRPIDPTLIETKENIVVTVLSEMVRFVESKYRNCKPDNLDNPEKKYNEYRESLKNLAEGLNVLEGIGDSGKVDADWENPQYVMERGLGRAKSGMNLERCLHDFIDKSLAFLNKKAFLLISSGSIPRGSPRNKLGFAG